MSVTNSSALSGFPTLKCKYLQFLQCPLEASTQNESTPVACVKVPNFTELKRMDTIYG